MEPRDLLCPLLYSSLVIGILCAYLAITDAYSLKGRLPPGPRGIPILGNVLQLSKFPWIRFSEWGDKFGPIFSLNLAGQRVIVLCTHKVTMDLLDRRGNIYSDRPRFILAGEILTGGITLPFLGYSTLWRKLRRAGHKGLHLHAAEKYQTLQRAEAITLVSGLLSTPNSLEEHIQRSALSTVISSTYAWPPLKSVNDPIILRIQNLLQRTSKAALPGGALVDIFPFLEYLPAWVAKWKREGLEWHTKDDIMFQGFMKGVRDRTENGDQGICFAASLLENEHDLNKKEAAWLAGTMIAAGSETTAAALSYFFLAMVLYPEVMIRGQSEIERVVGRERMPNFEDESRLPYVQAIVKEVLRWRPVFPVGIPRRTTQDDWYDGYYIPKGTLVIPNIWAMNRDPLVYPDYDEFRPERYLDASGQLGGSVSPDLRGQGHVSYGFGRRICLGMHAANQALFINVVSVLWALKIEKAIGSDGTEIVPSRTECIDEGVVIRPVPFQCIITPRSKEVVTIVESMRTQIK